MSNKSWYIYIVKSENEKLYTGITTDVVRRFQEHRDLPKKGAKFFNSSKAKEVIYVEQVKDRSQASQREASIKKLKRTEKIKLLEHKSNIVGKFTSELSNNAKIE